MPKNTFVSISVVSRTSQTRIWFACTKKACSFQGLIQVKHLYEPLAAASDNEMHCNNEENYHATRMKKPHKRTGTELAWLSQPSLVKPKQNSLFISSMAGSNTGCVRVDFGTSVRNCRIYGPKRRSVARTTSRQQRL